MDNLERWSAELPDEAQEAIPAGKHLKIVWSGAPRTKKNSPQLFRNVTDAWLRDFLLAFLEDFKPPSGQAPGPETRRGTMFIPEWGEIDGWVKGRDNQLPRPVLLPSKAFQTWEAASIERLLDTVLPPLKRFFPIHYPVKVVARIYREANQGDYMGYAQGIGDLLQKVGVLKDDVLIRSWDGTRLLKDADRPRVECFIFPFEVHDEDGLFQRAAKDWGTYQEPEPDPAKDAGEEPAGGPRQLMTIYRKEDKLA